MAETMNNNIFVKLASHCIGLDHRKPYKRHGKLFYRPYRNYFETHIGDETWEMMRLAGYAEHGRTNRNGTVDYWLTRKGLDWLGEQLGMTIWDEEE